jgi:hypothetical protein
MTRLGTTTPPITGSPPNPLPHKNKNFKTNQRPH